MWGSFPFQCSALLLISHACLSRSSGLEAAWSDHYCLRWAPKTTGKFTAFNPTLVLQEVEAKWAVRHEAEGAAVYEMLLDLSGMYVKSAQILASKGDFMPEPWVRRLAAMFDSMPPKPWNAVQRVRPPALHPGKARGSVIPGARLTLGDDCNMQGHLGAGFCLRAGPQVVNHNDSGFSKNNGSQCSVLVEGGLNQFAMQCNARRCTLSKYGALVNQWSTRWLLCVDPCLKLAWLKACYLGTGSAEGPAGEPGWAPAGTARTAHVAWGLPGERRARTHGLSFHRTGRIVCTIPVLAVMTTRVLKQVEFCDICLDKGKGTVAEVLDYREAGCSLSNGSRQKVLSVGNTGGLGQNFPSCSLLIGKVLRWRKLSEALLGLVNPADLACSGIPTAGECGAFEQGTASWARRRCFSWMAVE